MEKQDFLDKLRLALGGKVTPEVMTDTMNYYEEYINTELRLGKSPDEVMETLGDPRLIARTIVETKGRRYGDVSALSDEDGENGEGHELRVRLVRIPGWVWLIVFFIVIWLIVSFIFRVLIKFAPILLVIALATFIYKRLRGDI